MRHLKAFYVFHIAAESSSYSEAASKLNITHGAVSKQIKLLEAHLEQSLFYKTGRKMVLTKEGELLKQYTDMAFNALNTGVTKLKNVADSGLNISCEPTLSMRWLMPRLSGFYQTSGIDIRLSTAGGPVALNEAGLSMAIRRDDFVIPSNYHATQLVEEWVGPVFSPEYWREVSHQLEDITLLHSKTRPSAWSEWSISCGNTIHLNHSNQTFDHFYFSIQAAIDGLGATIGSYPLIADDIKNGRLIAPLGFCRSGHNYVLLNLAQELTTSEKLVQTWLKQELSQSIPD